MKNVRLFAVAAAMGMFASTVAAAEVSKPRVATKNATVVELTTAESIVRAEFGGNVVLPEYKTAAYTQSRTTKTPANYSYANQINGKSICYVGWTDEIGTDSNVDGMVDTPIYVLNANGSLPTNGDIAWFYDNAKSWATDTDARTWQYYAGLYGTVNEVPTYTGRVIAPGASAFSGWHLVKNHTNATAGNYTSVDDVLAALVANGVAEEVLDADGDLIGYKTASKYTYLPEGEEADGTANNNVVGKSVISTESFFVLTTDNITGTKESRKLADLKEEFVNYMSGAKLDTNVVDVDADAYVASIEYNNEVNEDGVVVATTALYEAVVNNVTYFDGISTPAITGTISIDPSIVNTATTTTTEVKIGTADLAANGVVIVVDGNGNITAVVNSSFANYDNDPEYADLAEYATKRYITIVQKYRTSYDVLDQFKPETYKNAALHHYSYDKEAAGFTKQNKAENDPGAHPDELYTTAVGRQKAVGGLYMVNTAANKTDKYLFDFNMGVDAYDGTMKLADIGEVNRVKKTITVGSKTFPIVEGFDGEWFPAFDTATELVDFMEAASGYGVPTGVIGKNSTTSEKAAETRLKQLKGGTRTWLNGDTTPGSFQPQNGLDALKAVQCTFGDADKTVSTETPTVTSNVASINTSEYGVKTLTLTATLGDAKATKDVQVVIAPKYEREWKNGKVSKLTAKHLNGNVYAVYVYDYTAKKCTVTFYKQDGVTVDSNAVLPL